MRPYACRLATCQLSRLAAALLFASGLLLPEVAGRAALADPAFFFATTPCRVYDTRTLPPPPDGLPLVHGVERSIAVAGTCGVPTTASAVALNLTVVDPSADGDVVLYPGDAPAPAPPRPGAFPFKAGKTRAKVDIVSLASNGDGDVNALATMTTGEVVHLIVDVFGYFVEDFPPVAVDDTPAAIFEDAAATAIDVLANDTDADGGPKAIASATDPANGTVVLTGGSPGAHTGLTYQPDPNYCNDPGGTPDTFDYTLTPGGSTATVSVTVTCVNDAPAGTDNTVSTPEDTVYAFAAADFGFTDPNDTPADALLAVTITTLPGAGTLTLSAVAVVAGQSIAVADLTAGNLEFTPAAGASGTPYTTFTFQVRDDGGTANGGIDLDPTPNTLTIDVTGVNNAPAGTDNTVTTNEDVAYAFAAADFGFTDPADTPPNALLAVTITTLPGAGTLALSAVPVVAGQSVAATDIAAGNLEFTPAAGASGAPYTSFTFQVQDDGGTAGGGVDLDPTPNTMTIDVNSVNDAPAGTDNTVATGEDTPYTFAAADFGFTDPNDTPADAFLAVTITTLPGAGTLALSAVPVVAGQSIPVGSIGNLVFTPAAGASGTPYTTFTFQVQDDGGTANGGVDLDPTPNTITVNVNDVNDAPAGTDNTVATNEGAPYAFVAADFGFTDPNDALPDAFLAVTITTLPGAGSLTLSAVPVVAGQSIPVGSIPNLVFTPAANGSGTPYTSFTFQVQDDGGTAGGGVDLDPTPNTMTINVNAVNDAPAGTDNTVTTNEDVPYTFAAADFGFTDPDDTPPNAFFAVTITTLPGAGSLALSAVAVVAGQSIPVGSIPNLVFTPAAGASGTPYTTFTFQVQDNGGTANGGVDLDPSANTMTVNVNPVNDAPAGTDNTVTTNEDVAYTFAAADFGFTDPNDTPPNAFFAVTITTLPGAGSLTLSAVPVVAGQSIAVGSIPNLVFTPAPNAFATPYASFTFKVQDNGGTANGGVDLDPSANTMTINVNSVNDPPVAGADAWTTIGNTELRVNLAAVGRPFLADALPANGVLANDADVVEGTAITLTGIPLCDTTGPTFGPCATTNGGTVTLEDNGTFTYVPAAGSSAADSFQYTIQDAEGAPATGTVNLTITEMVWYVDPDQSPGGNGTSVAPFDTLTAANVADTSSGDGDVADDLDGASHVIYIDDGTLNTAQTLELEASQRLIGEGEPLSFNLALNGNAAPASLAPAGNEPLHTHTTGNAVIVTTAIPIEIIGLSLQGTGNSIDLTTAAALAGSPTLTIANNTFRGAGAEGIDVNLNGGTTGTLALNVTNNTWNAAGTHTGSAVDINRLAGTLNLNFSGNTNLLSTGAVPAVLINGGAVANTTIIGFSSNTVHQASAGAGVSISNVTFDAVSGGAVQQVDGDNLSIGVDGDGVGGAGMMLSTVQGNLFFDDLDVYAGTSGLTITGTGSMTFAVTPATPDGSGTSEIKASNGAAVEVSTTTLDLRLAELSSTTSAAGVALSSVGANSRFRAPSGSTITKSSGGGTAFSVASSGSGTIVEYGGSLSVTSGAGVSLTNNSGSTIGFSGGMSLSTGANTGFNATGGGTVTVTDPGLGNNTITTAGGTALNVASTTIGSGDMTFESISAGTGGSPVNGIVLSNTGALGELIVTGTGAAGSGGTLQNTTGDGISLASTKTPSFSFMNISNTGGHGINSNALTAGFTVSGCQITGAGNGDNEHGINIDNTSGTVAVNGSTLTDAEENLIDVDNNNTNLTLSLGTTLANTYTHGTVGAFTGNAVLLVGRGSTSYTVNVENSQFNDIFLTALQVGGDGTSTGTHNIVFNNNDTDVTAGGPPFRSSNFNVQARNTSVVNITVTNNDMQGGGGGAIQVGADDSSNVEATITGNVVNNQRADGVLAGVDKSARLRLLITNNQISNTSSDGMEIANFDSDGGTPSELDAVIENNQVTNHNNNTAGNAFIAGIGVFSFSGPTCVKLAGNNVQGTPSPGTFFDYSLEDLGDTMTFEEVPNTAATVVTADYILDGGAPDVVDTTPPNIGGSNTLDLVAVGIELSNGVVVCDRP